MGLDIRAYSHLTYVGHHDQHHEAYAYDSFPHALLGVPNVQKHDRVLEFITGGCFETTDKTESHGFRAGSYSGYNAWRRDLAAQFNPTRENGQPSPEGPFYELIWFADNEGTICELAATSLLADFRAHEAEYLAAHADTSRDPFAYYAEKYADWMRACELAANGGLIDFH